MNSGAVPTAAAPAAGDAAEAELDERRLKVIADQAQGLRWQIVLTAIIIVALVLRSAGIAWSLAWFALVVVVREWRATALLRLATDRNTPIADRLGALVRWNLALGLANGSAALFMAVLDTSSDAVLTMILVSWAAGAVSTSATVARAFVAYAGPMFVPTAALWLSTGTAFGVGVAALVLMFFGVQLRFAQANLRTFEESYRIRQENEALARTLAAERAELARARDEAQQASQEKSRFLAAASHDLRQPLQALTLNAGALQHADLPEPARGIAHEVGTSAEHLRSMLDALLDLSKLDAGAVLAQPRRVRLDVVLQAVCASVRAQAVARGLTLSCEAPADLWVDSDPDLLRRMLANLLDNALKFTDRGGIAVSAVASEAEVEIAVSDTGRGIAPADQSRVFDDLVQIAHDGSRPAGHGLGLGIVRRAAQLLGSKLTLESQPGVGSTFRWRVPRAIDPTFEDEQAEGWIGLEGLSVLVLDDEAMVRGAYVTALTGRGARVLAAGTIEHALTLVAGAYAVLLDWRLSPEPGDVPDGFGALARLREARPGLAAVMLSGDMGHEIAEAARAAGVPLLRKPVDIETLCRALSIAASSRSGAVEPARASRE